MAGANGHASTFQDPILLRQVATLAGQVRNLGAPDRMAWFRGGSGLTPDPRRSLEDEYGWPTAPGPDVYDRLYDWDSVAARIVDLPVLQCWRANPWVYEDEDEGTETDFEDSFDNMVSSLRGDNNRYRPKPEQGGNPFFAAFRRLDALHRKGRYGVMWYGLDDGIDPALPAAGVTENGSYPIRFVKGEGLVWDQGKPPRDGVRHGVTINARQTAGRKLRFLKPFPESQAVVTRWEGNRNSPRYLQPLEYRITEIDLNGGYTGLGLPSSEVVVHWSRTTHHADVYSHAVGGGDQLAVPALQVPLYDVLDARKVTGASPEAFYRAVIGRLFFETLPQFGADAIVDEESVREMMEEMENSMQKHGVLKGLHANQTSTPVNDPTPHLAGKYQRIAMYLNKPKRIMEGSERGELSSGQDEKQDAEDIASRQNEYLSPYMLAPAVNRLIDVGVLTDTGEDGFKIEWPPVRNADEAQDADVFSKRSAAFAAALGGNVPAFLGDLNFLTEEAGYSKERAQQVLDDREEQALKEEEAAQAKADAIGAEPTPPPGFQHPPQPEPPQPVKVKPGEKLVIPPTANEEDVWDFETFEPVTNARKSLSGGHWVTTESGNHLYIRGGKIAAGNPYVMSAGDRKATGTREKEALAKAGEHLHAAGEARKAGDHQKSKDLTAASIGYQKAADHHAAGDHDKAEAVKRVAEEYASGKRHVGGNKK